MNLRTISFWVVYDPVQKMTVAERRSKKEIMESVHVPKGCVLIRVHGHYHRRTSRSMKEL